MSQTTLCLFPLPKGFFGRYYKYDRSPCTASTRGGRKPLQKQHTAYSIKRDPRAVEFAAGMGMDENHGNSTCTHQHLASQRNSIYSTISTLHIQLLPCTWTLDATNMFEVLTQTQFKVIIILALILYLQVPHLPDLGRHSMWGDGGTTIQQSMLSFSTSAVSYTDQQTSRLYRPVSVISHLCSNSSCPCVSNLFVCVCNVCGFCPFEGLN